MKYLKGYKKFVNESKIAIDKNALIVEKKVLEGFSSDFWNLCMRSEVFTTEEKAYIKENLSIEKVSLIKEEWKWLDNAIDWAKEKGEKALNYISDKIRKVREGIKEFVSSMIKLAKSLLSAGLKNALEYAKDAKKKFGGKLNKQVESLDPVKSKNEIEDLKNTISHWSPSIGKSSIAKGIVAIAISDQALVEIEQKMKESEAETVSSSTENIKEAEEESQSQNESISNILSSANGDVLMSFYNLVSEANEAGFLPVNPNDSKKGEEESEESEEKKEGKGVIGWILSFLGQEKMDPDAKLGKKLLWWGKLFLKILSACLSPILKLVEFAVKGGANKALKGVSTLTAKLGGPGVFEFALLGGLCAGIIGLIYDSIMMFGSKYEISDISGAGNLAAVKKWLAHAINDALELFPDYKTLKYIFAYFCGAMTLWHVIEEIKHLSHGGHEEKEKAAAPIAKPGTPPAPAAA